MAFPEPKPRAPELPQKQLKTLDCGQGAVRAVRFNGKTLAFIPVSRYVRPAVW